MRQYSKRTLAWIGVAVFVLAGTFGAGAATLNKRARFREGPSKETTLLGWIDGGTEVAIQGENQGWYAVRLPDGRTGYIWGDHIDQGAPPPVESGTVVAPESAPTPATPTPPGPTGPEADEVQSLRGDVAPIRERLEGDPSAEIERLRAEVARLANTQQELVQRLQGGGGVLPDVRGEASAAPAALFLGAGALIGWVACRIAQGRRDRRSRIRI